jgi:autophagy-related protein 18
VHCLAFSPEGYQPPLLAAASSHGTIHLFLLEQPHRSAAAAAASAAAGLLSAVINFAVTDMVGAKKGGGVTVIDVMYVNCSSCCLHAC